MFYIFDHLQLYGCCAYICNLNQQNILNVMFFKLFNEKSDVETNQENPHDAQKPEKDYSIIWSICLLGVAHFVSLFRQYCDNKKRYSPFIYIQICIYQSLLSLLLTPSYNTLITRRRRRIIAHEICVLAYLLVYVNRRAASRNRNRSDARSILLLGQNSVFVAAKSLMKNKE